MGKVENSQMEFGEIAIGEIHTQAKSRDDLPAMRKGIQHIYVSPQIRRRIFALLTEQTHPGINLKMWRPGMDLWRVLVVAVLQQGLGCDYDRMQEITHQLRILTKVMRLSSFSFAIGMVFRRYE